MTVGALPITMAPAAGGKSVATEFGWATPFSCASNTPRGGVATSGFNLSVFVGKTGAFVPVTNTYDTGTSAVETVPAGATNVVITMWGGGGGGSRDSTANAATGGASGGYVQRSQATSGGSTFTYTVGAAGIGKTTTNGNGGAGGATSLVSPSMTAGGGGGGIFAGTIATGGTATGGTTNTVGNAYLAGDPGGCTSPPGAGVRTVSVGVAPGGGGGASWTTTSGRNAAAGRITFYYT
jgi:hypothetical protein